MEKYILYALLLLGVILLIISLRKQPLIHWLFIYFVTAYFATFLGVIVVEKKMLNYPITLFHYFDSSVLFEYVLFPVISIYFYQTTFHQNITGVILQGVLYAGTLTLVEIGFVRYTNLINYYTWSSLHTFLSLLFLLLAVRGFVEVVRRTSRS